MIDAKQAAKTAADYLTQIVGTVHNVRIEEVELSQNELEWTITLSYSEDPYSFGGKQYKVFRINTNDGKVMSMKIRPLK
jgi:flagellar basal body P-ring protein FlgI